MRYSLALSAEARLSIRQQRDWYHTELEDGDELAVRWTRELDKALEKLREHPERYGLAAENGRWHPEVVIRRMLFRPWKSGVGWRVLFTVDEAHQVVTVLQVRHEHRLLLEEGEE
ncbi:MAG: type II toxin-antitoxin system RelE/ParE family toxin [Prosthecobacter sp.]|uniref:type II toxin-antitoxin system RelE/ParE family toxin n=1 Tax=Prosthecobacter sp. TaxID=1965333 RepID=UPI0019FAFE36|nr:type II toxin-antitoxin system RelE/ParE family toxin [Prosthecobacter sp.]MBE2282042.1 type II toxin-antitoxin system RelE/ParE family toxin [Prosthecobacter sp.]